MTFRVVLTSRAERDRDDAFHWYAENYSIDFAARWYDGLTLAIRSLSRNPTRFSVARESHTFPNEIREMLFGRRRQKHRVLFAISQDEVVVLHIRHSARCDLEIDDL
jgi:plasmid stabilization system protein ParE